MSNAEQKMNAHLKEIFIINVVIYRGPRKLIIN